MKILFLHGWHSVVGGVKPTHLRNAGHEVINPSLHDDDFELAVRTAQAAYDQHRPDVVVGSSRGGAIALNIRSRNTPLVLLCPAWKRWGKVSKLKSNAVILHSRADDVIPFTESQELIARSGLPLDALLEIGSDHRLADPEPLAAMLAACEQHAPKVMGCDFGVPKRAGEQARKIILIEAVAVGPQRYAVRPRGRNQRLVNWLSGDRSWPGGRAGWTLPELTASLAAHTSPAAVAMDFPFGIPQSLLDSSEFARAAGTTKPFATRAAWIKLVTRKVKLEFTDDQANGEMVTLSEFDRWRVDSRFWQRRATDLAAKGQPPLKHVGQSLFAMTIGGACLLNALEATGWNVVLDRFPSPRSRAVFETYPSGVAQRIGFRGRYKSESSACLQRALEFLSEQGIQIDLDADVRRFCEAYRTGAKADDPDGADAFLCLVSAICYRAGKAELVRGIADNTVLKNEGAIVLPICDRHTIEPGRQ